MSNRLPAEELFIADQMVSRISQHELDQLMDGDVNPDERRRLIAALVLVFVGGLAIGRSWPISSPSLSPQMALKGSTPETAGTQQVSSPGKREQLIVHVLGFMNVEGEDGARHAVPIVAAPGLKVDLPPRQPATLAGARRVAIPAELVSVATRGPPAY